MRRRIFLVVPVVALVVVGVAAFALWPRGTTEVSRSDALADYRERASTVAEGPTGSVPEQRSTPRPGVYTYAAQGEEVVKLGPLPAQTRPLPETVTAVVVDAGNGCFEWTVNLFVEHTEDTRYCASGDTLRLDEHVKHQKIGPLEPTATMSCDPDILRSAAGAPAELRCTLSLTGGPASITSTLEGAVEVGEAEARTVGAASVSTTPVTVSYRVSGDLTGSWAETVWWTDDHLPVRIERTFDLQGLATFSERSQLELTSLEPQG